MAGVVALLLQKYVENGRTVFKVIPASTQMVLSLKRKTAGDWCNCFIIMLSLFEQPNSFITCTQYLPILLTVSVSALSPFCHKYVVKPLPACNTLPCPR